MYSRPLPLDCYLRFPHTHIAAAQLQKGHCSAATPAMHALTKVHAKQSVPAQFDQSRPCNFLMQACCCWTFSTTFLFTSRYAYVFCRGQNICLHGWWVCIKSRCAMHTVMSNIHMVGCTDWKSIGVLFEGISKPSHCTCQQWCDCICTLRNMFIMCLLHAHYMLPACSECSYT